jgi:hypothetical protein
LKNLGHVYRDDGYFLVAAPAGMHDGWIAVSLVEPTMESKSDMELVASMVKNPTRFMIEGRDTKTNFANQFLFALDGSANAVIENDQGCIASVSSFQSLAKAGISWLNVPQITEVDVDTADSPTNTQSMPSVL